MDESAAEADDMRAEKDRGPIYQRIDAVYAILPPRAQRVADTVLENLGNVGTYTVAELAELSGTSTATVSRLFATLGFEDFSEVRNHVRALRGGGMPLGVSSTPADGDERIRQELENIRRVSQLLTGGLLERLATILGDARSVLVIGQRSSYPVALRLRESLAQTRPGVALAPQPGQSIGEELTHLGSGDAVIIVGFRRRVSTFHELMKFLPTTGATIVLFADSTARRFTQYADLWVECPIDSVGPFDSYAAAMSAATQITDAVLERLGPTGKRNIMRTATSFEELGEIHASDLGR